MPGVSPGWQRFVDWAMDAYLDEPPFATVWDETDGQPPPKGASSDRSKALVHDESEEQQLSLARIGAESGPEALAESGGKSTDTSFLVSALVQLLCGVSEERPSRQRQLFVLVSKVELEPIKYFFLKGARKK